MARGGARPGAGKKKGKPEYATLEAQLVTAQQQLATLTAEREAEKAGRGRKLAIDVLDDIMHAGYGLMAKHQPLEPGEVVHPGSGRDPNEEKFRYFLDVTKDAAKGLANFQSPKFKSITVGVDASLAAAASAAPSAQVPGTTRQLSPAQAYRMLRDSDVIDLTPAAPTEDKPAKKAKRA